MMKRFFQALLAFVLALSLTCPSRAAGSPTLLMQNGSGTGNVLLTLQNMGNREAGSIQLELALTGSYPRAGFSMAGAPSDRYSHCRVEEYGGQTRITVYIDGLRNLNQSGTVPLGTLSLGGGYTAPTSARLTVLSRSLESDSSSTIPVQSAGGGTTSPGWPTTPGEAAYSVRASSTGRGAVMVNPGSARYGETVVITVRPDSGYQLSELVAVGDGRRLQLNDIGGGSFSFVMPDADVEVRGTFTALAVETRLPFTDVREGVWFHDAVKYANENSLMSGTSATTFSPDQPTSRGMIVTILYRLAGSPAAGNSGFTDVAPGQYYAKAVAWASANGVVSGYGNGRFGPNDPITREQMAVILWRYAGSPAPPHLTLTFSDIGKANSYAMDALRWAVDRQLISGTSATTLSPGGTATRAQAAVILKGFCQNVLD